jgi:hypothetical protein
MVEKKRLKGWTLTIVQVKYIDTIISIGSKVLRSDKFGISLDRGSSLELGKLV